MWVLCLGLCHTFSETSSVWWLGCCNCQWVWFVSSQVLDQPTLCKRPPPGPLLIVFCLEKRQCIQSRVVNRSIKLLLLMTCSSFNASPIRFYLLWAVPADFWKLLLLLNPFYSPVWISLTILSIASFSFASPLCPASSEKRLPWGSNLLCADPTASL